MFAAPYSVSIIMEVLVPTQEIIMEVTSMFISFGHCDCRIKIILQFSHLEYQDIVYEL